MNQFILAFGFGMVEAMIAPFLKKHGASDYDIAMLFLGLGITAVFGNVLCAQVNVIQLSLFSFQSQLHHNELKGSNMSNSHFFFNYS